MRNTEELDQQKQEELAMLASAIEDNLHDEQLLLTKIEELAEKLDVEQHERAFFRAKVRAQIELEKRERAKAMRERKRVLWCILVYVCKINPLIAFSLCALVDQINETERSGMDC